ncbi:MAG: NAD(P)-binding domain-containing protein [Planctomycetota bacterium]|nr:NAD(P)-binding domain-containing protein [Planctomycetota bacterium]
MSPRLVIVGFGNLGQAIARGAIESGIAAPSEIGAIDPEAAQLVRAKEHGLRMADQAKIGGSEVVLLAVKPQSFAEAAKSLGKIGAGASRRLRRALGRSAPTDRW